MFNDINLKFAVISCLNEFGYYVSEADKLKNELFGTPKFDRLGYDDLIPEIFEYYSRVRIENEKLDLISEFNPSASNKCYNLLVKEWSGEDNIFDIVSLNGIESLKNLKVFNPFGLLSYDVDISALHDCNNLTTVYTEFIPDSDSCNNIIAELKGNGIKII